jgi:hypothetical protein
LTRKKDLNIGQLQKLVLEDLSLQRNQVRKNLLKQSGGASSRHGLLVSILFASAAPSYGAST